MKATKCFWKRICGIHHVTSITSIQKAYWPYKHLLFQVLLPLIIGNNAAAPCVWTLRTPTINLLTYLLTYLLITTAEHRQNPSLWKSNKYFRTLFSVYEYSVDDQYKHLFLALQQARGLSYWESVGPGPAGGGNDRTRVRDWQRCRRNNDRCWQQQWTAVKSTAVYWLHAKPQHFWRH